MAIEDAGLQVGDIDGVVSLYHRRLDTIPPKDLISILSNKELNCCVFNVTGPGT